MPAKSKAQRNLMAAAEHGASFPLARKVRASMSKAQLHDFASVNANDLPKHVKRLKASGHHESHAYDWRSRNNLKRGRG